MEFIETRPFRMFCVKKSQRNQLMVPHIVELAKWGGKWDRDVDELKFYVAMTILIFGHFIVTLHSVMLAQCLY